MTQSMSVGQHESTVAENTAQFHMLVVDDDSLIRANLREYLSQYHQADYTLLVDEASTAEEAVECLRQKLYDLVICDINLPDNDGFYVLKHAAQLRPKCRRALITAYDLDTYIRMAKEQRVFNIITKAAPFNFHELSQTVNHLLLPQTALGLTHYLDELTEPMVTIEIRSSEQIMTVQQSLDTFFRRFNLPDVDALSVVMIEAITNAVYHAPKNPDGTDKYEKGSLIPELLPDEYVYVSWGVDGDKLAVSIRDQKGSISADEVMYWIDRNVAGESLMDTHGRGVYLIYRLMDRVIINLHRHHTTELILMHYLHEPPPNNKPLYINEF